MFLQYQNLTSHGVMGLTVFARGGLLYMVLSLGGSNQNSLMLLWSNNQFGNQQDVPITGTMGVESLAIGGDIYIVFIQGMQGVNIVFLGRNL